jgi:hypothetical protein
MLDCVGPGCGDGRPPIGISPARATLEITQARMVAIRKRFIENFSLTNLMQELLHRQDKS